MTPEQEIERSRNAKRVLDDAMYQEAFAAIRERIVGQLSLVELAPDKRARLNDLLVSLSAVHKYMQNVMEGGKIAAQEIERQRTLGERLRAVNW